ncbi:MAG: Ger(x)C family spore germination protein [Bacilli bacterium]|nr:Ger(x)C family spore germination protein [Bacilli bacterium]
MKKEFILVIAVVISGFVLFLSLVEFRNPVSTSGDIEDNSLVLAVGIDKATQENNKIRLTVIGEKFSSSSQDKSSQSQGKNADIASAEGSTMFDTIRNFSLFESKSLFFGHIKYILINENIAKENILDVLDFFIRDHELRLDTKIVIVKDMSAEAFLRSGDKVEQFIPDALEGVFHNTGKISISSEIELADLMQTFDSEYSDAYIPSIGIVKLKKDEMESTSQAGNTSQTEGTSKKENISQTENTSQIGSSAKVVSDSKKEESSQPVNSSTSEDSSKTESSSEAKSTSQSTSKESYYLNLDGYATFNGTKLLGYISDYTARGLNWLNGNVKTGVIVVKDSKGSDISMEILRAQSKINLKLNNDVPEAEINIQFSSNLAEVMSQDNVFYQEETKKLKEEQENSVKREAEMALEYAQKNGIDIIKMGDAVYHKYPLKWDDMKDNWKEIFKKMKITIKVDANIGTVYHIRQPVGSKSGENK